MPMESVCFSFKNEQLPCGFFEGCTLSFAQKMHMSVSACRSVAWEGMGLSDRYRVVLLSDWARDPISAKVLSPFWWNLLELKLTRPVQVKGVPLNTFFLKLDC